MWPSLPMDRFVPEATEAAFVAMQLPTLSSQVTLDYSVFSDVTWSASSAQRRENSRFPGMFVTQVALLRGEEGHLRTRTRAGEVWATPHRGSVGSGPWARSLMLCEAGPQITCDCSVARWLGYNEVHENCPHHSCPVFRALRRVPPHFVVTSA